MREKKQNKTTGDPEEFTAFFEKLYAANQEGKDKHIQEYVETTLNNIPASELENDFSLEELKYAIKKLKNNKATGPDRIPSEVFKNSPDSLLNLILKIMNKIKTENQYPAKWALGITTLLLKEGNDEDPNNYRAITVSDSISKILAIMINERLGKWYSEKKIMRQEQIGFKKNSRPADHLFVLKTLINSYTNQGKKIICLLRTFKKLSIVYGESVFFTS